MNINDKNDFEKAEARRKAREEYKQRKSVYSDDRRQLMEIVYNDATVSKKDVDEYIERRFWGFMGDAEGENDLWWDTEFVAQIEANITEFIEDDDEFGDLARSVIPKIVIMEIREVFCSLEEDGKSEQAKARREAREADEKQRYMYSYNRYKLIANLYDGATVSKESIDELIKQEVDKYRELNRENELDMWWDTEFVKDVEKKIKEDIKEFPISKDWGISDESISIGSTMFSKDKAISMCSSIFTKIVIMDIKNEILEEEAKARREAEEEAEKKRKEEAKRSLRKTALCESCYKSFLVLARIKDAKTDEDIKFHVNQGLWLVILEILAFVLLFVPDVGVLLSFALLVFSIFFSVRGWSHVDEKKEIPLVGKIKILK